MLTPEARDLLGDVAGQLAAVEPWTAEATEQAVRGFAEQRGAKLGAVAQPLRAALTGRTTSPGIFEVLNRARQGRKAWRGLPIRRRGTTAIDARSGVG